MPDFSKNLEQTYKANQPEISRLKSQRNLHSDFFEREKQIFRNAEQIVNDWGEVIVQHDTVNSFFDIKFLPHDKEVIFKAVQMAYSKT